MLFPRTSIRRSKPTSQGFLKTSSNWLERFPKGSISTWVDLTTRFLAQFFPPGRTAKLQNDILMFQQHQGEYLSEEWNHFKDLLRKVPHHGIDLWLQVQIFYNRIDHTLKRTEEGWNDPIFLEEGSLNYKNANIEQLLGVMECQVDTLMKDVISLMGKSGDLYGLTSNTMRQLPPEPSHLKEFGGLVTNFILDQEEKVCQLEEYMCVIGSDFMQLSLEVVEKLKEEIRVEKNKFTKIKKITRYPDTKDLEPLNGHKFPEAFT
ncbi:zinc finger, CCHC-type containing protein [Tanacetum coccineum]